MNIESDIACTREYVCRNIKPNLSNARECIIRIHVADMCKHHAVRLQIQHRDYPPGTQYAAAVDLPAPHSHKNASEN